MCRAGKVGPDFTPRAPRSSAPRSFFRGNPWGKEHPFGRHPRSTPPLNLPDPMRRMPAVNPLAVFRYPRDDASRERRRAPSGGAVATRVAPRPSTSPGPRRSRAGPEAPGETFPRRENGEQEDDQAAMEDDQTREEDPVGDDREAFKREQELQFSMNAIRQKAPIRTRPMGSEELERWDPDADQTSGSETNDGTAGDPSGPGTDRARRQGPARPRLPVDVPSASRETHLR